MWTYERERDGAEQTALTRPIIPDNDVPASGFMVVNLPYKALYGSEIFQLDLV